MLPSCGAQRYEKAAYYQHADLEIHGEVYDGYGDYEMVNRRFVVDRKACTIGFTNLDNDQQEQTVTLAQDKMRKLLKRMVHSLEIFMWEQDYCGGSNSDKIELVCLDDEGGDEDEPVDFDLARFVDSISLPVEPRDEIPIWNVNAEYSNDTVQDIACYGGDVADKVEELYWEMLDNFTMDKDFTVDEKT